MGKNKQKIDYRSIEYISEHKLRQMYESYTDWCKKNNYNLVNMNMPYPLKYKIEMVVDELKRRLKQQKTLEEYFSYDAKIKINNKINKIIDEVFDNGNKGTED